MAKKKTREELVEEYLPKVNAIVTRFMRKNPNSRWASHALHSNATDRLLRVIDRFLAGKVKNFDFYLRLNIRGALIDAIRKANSDPTLYDPNITASGRGFKPWISSERPMGGEELAISRESLDEACEDEIDRALVSMIRVRRTVKRNSKKMSEDQLVEAELKPVARELGITVLELQERAGRILRRYKKAFYG